MKLSGRELRNMCHTFCGTEEFLVLNRGVFGVQLRGFRCGTDGCVELRGFGVKLRDFEG